MHFTYFACSENKGSVRKDLCRLRYHMKGKMKQVSLEQDSRAFKAPLQDL